MWSRQIVKPYWAVLQTYLRRPLFVWLGIACVFWPALDVAGHLSWLRGLPRIRYSLIGEILESTTRLYLPIVLGVGWTAHLREQLAGERGRLVPRFAMPHFRIAKLVLATLIVAVPACWLADELSLGRAVVRWDLLGRPVPNYELMGQYAGALMVSAVLVVTAATSATFGSPWTSLLLVPIAFIATVAAECEPWEWYGNLQKYLSPFFPVWIYTGYWFPAMIAGSILGPLLVVGVARPVLWARLQRLVEIETGRSSPPVRSPAVGLVRRYTPVGSLWSRVRQRRSPVLTGFAPWFVGLLVAVLLMFYPLAFFDRAVPTTQLQISLILATILPAVAVGCIWAERWPRVGAESLLPATRRGFVLEMAAAVGIDLAAFWVAVAAGVTVPLLLCPAVPVDGPALAARLGASAGVQLLALAAVLWAMVLRSWPAMATLLGVALAGMAGPLLMSSKRVPMVPIATLAPASGVVAAVGVVLAVAACRRWAAADLA